MDPASGVTIVGGGLAGCEAAWQAVSRGCPVRLLEMRPQVTTPAHTTGLLAELVCSNSLRSAEISSAIGLLKEEMRQLGSLIMAAAAETEVPAGKALAVDREAFASAVTGRLEAHPLVTVVRREVATIPKPEETGGPVVIATGPLTSPALTAALQDLVGHRQLAFYDAIAPIVAADSIDRTQVYSASRYQDGPGDYLNCPMDAGQYQTFIEALAGAQTVPLRDFEEPRYFEGCLPIEVMLERGPETLRFGPMKPVGLPDPRTGALPHAVVQLRQENRQADAYNLVGFQTKLTYPEQDRVFRLIPGLAAASFLRYGSIHRNTFVCAPVILEPTLGMKGQPGLFLAGQLTGVEGYVESAAMGLLAGINAARLTAGLAPVVPPPATALGSLITHLTMSEARHFQPSNVNFGLFPALGRKVPRRLRGAEHARRALEALAAWRACLAER
ncbi:MAG: methylenetetrahydrofolate--tRNA-(uracil(54)-C(5))-methyltransferase (FADH(2)-oxidizing) TrmFO [Thermodesulfobacteriota bacterium]